MKNIPQTGISPFSKKITVAKSLRSVGAGIWLDPSDMSTMYQDAAGTVPVTSLGQPVGKILDKSGNGNHAFQNANADFRPTLEQTANGEWYLEFDGIDDFLETSSIDFSSGDEMTIVTGGYRDNLENLGALLEFSSNYTNFDGTLKLNWPNSSGGTKFGAISKGTTKQSVNVTAFAGTPHVLAMQSDISGDFVKATVNGVSSTSGSDQGTGNYGNYSLYIGARGGTSQHFEGRLYGLVLLPSNISEKEYNRIKRLIGIKTGVVI